MLPENNRAHKSDDMIEVPVPTPWPFVIAFGLTLMLAGIVTSLAVTIVGFLVVLLAARGLFRNVFPEPQEELVQVRRTFALIAVSTRRVDHLLPGIESHRVYIPVAVHPYSAGLIAGIFGGVGMAIIACLYGLIAYRSIWYPINLLAAVALPSLAEAGPATLKALAQ